MNNSTVPRRPKVLLFDINETILDVTPLRNALNNAFGQGVFDLWFTTLLHYSLVANATGRYFTFGDIGTASLQMLSEKKGMALNEGECKRLVGLLASLPPHEDVVESLEMLRKEGFSIVALSNSSTSSLSAQLEHAGIAILFDKQISVESFGQYKPASDVYIKAAQSMNVGRNECMLIAAHGWDIFGALSAGLRAAFVKRPGQALFPLSPKPELMGNDLISIATDLTSMIPYFRHFESLIPTKT